MKIDRDFVSIEQFISSVALAIATESTLKENKVSQTAEEFSTYLHRS